MKNFKEKKHDENWNIKEIENVKKIEKWRNWKMN